MSWTPYLVLGIIAFIIFSRPLFAITDTLLSPFGINTEDAYGRPTWFGLLLQTVIFVLIVKWIL